MELEFYQESEYLRKEALQLEGEVFEFNSTKGITIPLIKRNIPNTAYFDLVSPYGYPGIYGPELSLVLIEEALQELQEFSAKNKIVASFIRLNPITNRFLFSENEVLTQKVHGRVVTVPLFNAYTDLSKGYSSNHKRGLKKLKKEGFEVCVGGWNDIDDFISLYNETMTRLEASEYYFFDKDYYKTLFGLDSEFLLLFVLNKNGEKVSGALFSVSDQILQYHLGGTKEAYVAKSPNKLLFDWVINKFSENKQYLNLGGGLNNRNDSLFNFKKGFSKVTHQFSTLRMVHLLDQYNNLCKDFTKVEIKDREAFFPLYRS